MGIRRAAIQTTADRTVSYQSGQSTNGTISSGGGSTLVTSIVYTDNNYNTLTANAAATTFGTFRILGTGFANGANVMLANTSAGTIANVTTNTSYVNSSEIRANVSVTAGNYTLYVLNPNGSAAIYYSGILFEPYPQWTITSYSAVNPVNIQLLTSSTAVEQPITYALVSGTLPTGTTLSANGLITGTVTQANVIQAYTFTVSATDIYNETTQSSITLTISLSDIYFNQTTLLLNGETNTNTYIQDISTNNFAVTPYGAATSNRFNPFWPTGYYGNYFDGSSGYFYMGSPSNWSFLNNGTTNYTVEFWAYPTTSTSNQLILGTDSTVYGAGMYISINGTNVGDVALGINNSNPGGLGWTTNTGGWVPLNTWTHVAVCIAVNALATQSVVTIYTNGVSRPLTLATNGGSPDGWSSGTSNSLLVGAVQGVSGHSPSASYFYNGNLSNLRITKSIVYTGNFIPPTAPLTLSQSASGNISATTFANTALLTCQSNQFIDNGPSGFTITTAGTVKVVPNNPFSVVNNNGYYSNYFNGSAVLSYTQAAALSGDFTIECWVNIQALPSINYWLWGYRNGADTSPYFFISSDGSVRFGGDVTNFLVSSASAVPLNTWNHIAVVRIGTGTNNLKLYVNGNQVAQSNTTQSFSYTGSQGIGKSITSTTYYLSGYISNFRIVNGTGVYTTAFTPPTTALTAVSNTALLTCQSNIIVDNSVNNVTLTNTNVTSSSFYLPFTPVTSNGFPTTATANTNNVGYYSTWFDGSTGGINTPINPTALQLGSNNFTIEAWINLSNTPSGLAIVFGCESTTYDGILFGISTSNTLQMNISSNGSTYNLFNGSTFSTVIKTNSWTHVALVRNNGTIYAYINGVQDSTTYNISTNSIYFNSVAVGAIGIRPPTQSAYFPGYISNLRVVNGTSVYTTAFTPSTTPLTAIANTSLLACQNSTLVDNSTNAYTLTSVGKTVLSQNQPFVSLSATSNTITPSIYGSSYFDGSSSYLQLGGQNAFAFGTGNFTIECWFYTTTASSTQEIYSSQTNGSYITAPDIYIQSSKFYVQVAGSNPINGSGPTTVISNTWYHVALVKNGSTTTLYVNGTYEASFSDSNTYVIGANRPVIGVYGYGANYYFSGYISNLRVVKGTALYTGNFLPSNQPLTPVANTSLLTLQNKNSANNNLFYDDSVNNLLFTRAGVATQGTFTPFSQTGWSQYFDGTTNCQVAWPTTAWVALNSSTAWTVEFWVNPTVAVTAVDGAQLYGMNVNGNPSGQYITIMPTTQKVGISSAGSGGFTSPMPLSNTAIPQNAWTHVAMTISGASGSATVKIYINGVLDSTTANVVTGISNPGGNAFSGTRGDTSVYNFQGYLSNFRIVNGSIVYTSNFTPPTSPLTAIANTSVLIYNSNRLYDQGQNANSVSSGTGTFVQAFSPFAPGVNYTAANTGGSIYFDGSSGGISTPANPVALQLGSNNFTVEAWVYLTALPSSVESVLFGVEGTVAYGNLFAINTSGILIINLSSNGSSYNLYNGSAFNTALKLNTWYHIAWVRNGTTLYAFVNGVQESTTYSLSTTALYYTSAMIASVGLRPTNTTYYFPGYVSNLRVTNGQAIYVTNFTPPTAPFVPNQYTSLLLSATNAGIQDATGKNDIITYGSSKTQANTVKYGSGAMYFDGSTSGITTTTKPYFAFGANNFTIEYWVYPISWSNGPTVIDFRGTQGTLGFTDYYSTSGVPNIYKEGTGTILTSNTAVSVNTWTHIAYVRNSNTMTIYVNGANTGGVTDTTTWVAPSNNATFGAGYGLQLFFNGYLDDLRVTKGVARYTSNFAPPSSAFLTE